MNAAAAYFDFLTRELGDPDSRLANPSPEDLEVDAVGEFTR
ncbi:hypothetical protein [Frateuria sp. Soil773]|nr:hypothetical protein [Frateuria sp. Soil773]